MEGEPPAKAKRTVPWTAIPWIAMIAVLVALVLLLPWSPNLTPGTSVLLPNVGFDAPEEVSANQWRIRVGGVSQAKDLSLFKAVLHRNGSVVDVMEPLSGTPTASIDFADWDGDGKLTGGDSFMITCDPSGSYELHIFFEDYSVVLGSASWET
ncbi:MAG: hypothetical protein LN415_09115 [Candidatus Thermoplasmatota archaeon]|nr:hypothetical protein [Candidatus Thermoplasmatota archaeon]